MRPTKVRAWSGSSASGSSARPMRRVCAASGLLISAASAAVRIVRPYRMIRSPRSFFGPIVARIFTGGSLTARLAEIFLQPAQPRAGRRRGEDFGHRRELAPEMARYTVVERGRLAAAAFARVWAARMEAAARPRIDRVGDVALEVDARRGARAAGGRVGR